MNTIESVDNKIANLNNLLDRKIELLENMLNISISQGKMFQYKDEEVGELLKASIREKQNIIDELLNIDDMFLSIFESFSGELNENKSIFSQQIYLLKRKIEKINDIDIKIRLEEARNKQISLSPKNYTFNEMPKSKKDLIDKYNQNSKKTSI